MDRTIQSRLTVISPNYGTCQDTSAALYVVKNGVRDDEIISLALKSITRDRSMMFFSESVADEDAEFRFWAITTSKEINSLDLRDHLDYLIGCIEESKAVLEMLLKIKNIKIWIQGNWYSKYGDGGPAIWPEQSRRIAKLNLPLRFYFSFSMVEDEHLVEIGEE